MSNLSTDIRTAVANEKEPREQGRRGYETSGIWDVSCAVSAKRKFRRARADLKHSPGFASPHEAYAVILEEYDEAGEQELEFGGQLEDLRTSTKKDHSDSVLIKKLRAMQETAMRAAAEWVQVAVMCRKAMGGQA
jgi:hypothetical protein